MKQKVGSWPAWVKQSDGQGLNLVDTVNHTSSTLVIPDAETLKYCDQFSLTKDNRYIIAWNEGGRIYRIGADGQTETLALGEHVVLDKINDLEMVDAKYWADAARQTADGSIIAATCDGKQITFWREGGQMENIPVPQDTRWTVVSGWSMPRLFRIGPNGLMVLSDFASEASTELEHFSVYHFAEKKWKQMDDAAHGSPDRLMGVMLAVTLTALTMTILTKFAGTTANLGGDLLQGCFAIALFVLGVTVAVQGVKKLFGKKETVNA